MTAFGPDHRRYVITDGPDFRPICVCGWIGTPKLDYAAATVAVCEVELLARERDTILDRLNPSARVQVRSINEVTA